MTKTLIQTYSIAREYRRQITLALVATGAVFAFLYAVNLYRLVSYSVAIREVTSQIASLDASLDELDARYVSISKTLTPDTINAHGFGQTQVSAFIPRAVSLGRASLSGHEL